jgi:hypothetical protein
VQNHVFKISPKPRLDRNQYLVFLVEQVKIFVSNIHQTFVELFGYEVGLEVRDKYHF